MESLEQQLQKSFLWLERLNPDSQEVIKLQLAKVQKEIIALVSETKNKAVIQREINKLLNQAFSTFETVFVQDIENITELSWNATQNIMASWTTIEAVKFKDTSKAIKEKLLNPNVTVQGLTLQEHFRKLNFDNSLKLKSQLVKGFESGASIQQISSEIRNTIGGMYRNQINSLIRTSLLESIRNSQNETFEYFEDEIIEYYYDSVLDTRTTPRCFNLNGTSSKNKQDIVKLLNYHYQCRSLLGVRTKLSKEFDEGQTQNLVEWEGKKVNHRDGTKSTKFKVDDVKKVPLNATPEQAFKKFSPEFQKQYMGKTRYDLWKSGKVSFDEMIRNSRNSFIPVKDLKAKLNLQ